MSQSVLADGDEVIGFIVGTLPDGRVVLDFRRHIDHLKLDQEKALELAEGLVEAVKQASLHGRIIQTGGPLDG